MSPFRSGRFYLYTASFRPFQTFPCSIWSENGYVIIQEVYLMFLQRSLVYSYLMCQLSYLSSTDNAGRIRSYPHTLVYFTMTSSKEHWVDFVFMDLSMIYIFSFLYWKKIEKIRNFFWKGRITFCCWIWCKLSSGNLSCPRNLLVLSWL